MDIALPKYARSYNGYFLMKFTSQVQRQQAILRIAFKTDIPGAISLDIGSIRDIAVPVLAEDVDKIHFRDGKLNYPIYQYT